MPVNITDVDEFTSPITTPAGADAANAASVAQIAQKLANRTRNLHNRVEDIEDRISASGEWTYPSAKSRSIEILPCAFEPRGSFRWPWAYASGYAETDKSSGSDRAELTLQLNRVIPGNALITAIRVLVTPGAARSSPNKVGAYLYSRAPSTYTGSVAAGATGLEDSAEDNGGTSLQALVVGDGGVDMTIGYAVWLTVVSGSGDTSEDRFYGVRIEYTDYGPINI